MGLTINVALDRKVSIDEEVVTQDATYKSNVPTWQQITTVWAEVVDALPSRSLVVRQGLEAAALQTRVRVRYDERLATASRKRIRFGTRVLQVVGGPAEIGRRQYMEFACEELTTAGGAA
jgi:head-tail adaptor